MHEDLQPATLGGTRLEKYFHTCAFFRSCDEEYRVLSPFLVEGLEGGERIVYIVDPEVEDRHRWRCVAAGVQRADDPRQFEVRTWQETYLHDGRFDQDFMLATVQETIRTGLDHGFPRLRIVGQMGWALRDHAGVDQLMEYEVRVNDVLARTRNPAVCVYDLNALSGAMMMDLLRAHPMTVVGGTLYENPFYTPPEQMLEELRARKISVRASA